MVTIPAAERRLTEKTYKIKYEALKELEKGIPQKEVGCSTFWTPYQREKKQGQDFPNVWKWASGQKS